MADVKWIKIVTDIFDDEKILLIETLPEADSIIVIWFKLLCLAGKQNNSGVFTMNDKMPYNEKMFATIFRRKEATVQLALKTFEEFGMIEIIEGTVTIPNWGKHQSLDKIESRNEYMRNYMAEYREKQKALTGKANSKVNSKANVNSLDKIRVDKKREDKSVYGTFNNVRLTLTECKKLEAEYGEAATIDAIEFLSAYREEKGYKNKNDYLSIKRWVFDAVKERTSKGNPFKEALRKEIENEQKGSYSNYDGYQGGLSKLLQEPDGD